MNLQELCFNLGSRRRMYLLDDRFSTAVAFVEGYNAAYDGAPLSGFQNYVADRVIGRNSSLHWAYLIASTRIPEILEGGNSIDQIPAELQSDLTNTLVELLDSYRAEMLSAETAM